MLPHLRMDSICSGVQMSRSIDLTRLMCVPMLRWMPEQRIHRKQPRFHDAQRVSLRLQSAHILFSGCFTRLRRVRALASVSALDCGLRVAYDIVAPARLGFRVKPLACAAPAAPRGAHVTCQWRSVEET